MQAVKHPLLFIQMSHGNMGESQNCVHRCPYIMGHISQKYALGPVCVCRALQRVFQKDPLLFLAALLLRLICESDDQFTQRCIQGSGPDDLRLLVNRSAAALCSEDKGEDLLPFHISAKNIRAEKMYEFFLVLVKNAFLHKGIDCIGIRRHKAVRILSHNRFVAPVDHVTVRFQIDQKSGCIIPGEGRDHSFPAVTLLFDLLLRGNIAQDKDTDHFTGILILCEQDALPQIIGLSVSVQDAVGKIIIALPLGKAVQNVLPVHDGIKILAVAGLHDSLPPAPEMNIQRTGYFHTGSCVEHILIGGFSRKNLIPGEIDLIKADGIFFQDIQIAGFPGTPVLRSILIDFRHLRQNPVFNRK